MAEKPLLWVGSSLKAIRDFPEAARRQAGYELFRVQRGEDPTDWKPMTAVGAGVAEIRVHTALEHRVFYVAKFAEAVYVLHAFEKRTQRTRREDVDLAKRRFEALKQSRSRGGG
jgi:phage-related protein